MLPDALDPPDGALIVELSGQLTALLARIDAGDLAASAAMRCRVEGALVVLRLLQGEDSITLVDALANDVPSGLRP